MVTEKLISEVNEEFEAERKAERKAQLDKACTLADDYVTIALSCVKLPVTDVNVLQALLKNAYLEGYFER